MKDESPSALIAIPSGVATKHRLGALSIYAIRASGSDFRKLAKKPSHCLGSPKWSPDGKRVLYYEMTRDTWGTHRPESLKAWLPNWSPLVPRLGLIEHTSGAGLETFPRGLSKGTIAYLLGYMANEKLDHLAGNTTVSAARSSHSPE